jgi:pantoate--beta-alanine ligase
LRAVTLAVARYPLWNWSIEMITSVRVIGSGRVGSAVSARLRERGIALDADGAEIVLLCVPDAAIPEVAAGVEPGPWIGHVSGATPLAVVAPHVRRFSLHPLQTFTRGSGPQHLDGAWAAVTGESPEALAVGFELAEVLGLRPFELDDDHRALYHAGAAIASNYLVTLQRAAARLLEEAGAPSEALAPLMRRTVESGFELTGPVARGDWDTVERHVAAIRSTAPELERPYRVLADMTAALANGAERRPVPRAPAVVRTVRELREELDRRRDTGRVGLVPTMGAFHEGHLLLFRAARDECDLVVVSLFVNPTQFGAGEDLDRYPRDEDRDLRLAEQEGVDVLFAPSPEEMYPPGYQTWVDVEELGRTLEGALRPGHFRGVATVCLKLFNLVRPDRAYFGQKDAQQAAVLKRMLRDLNLDLDLQVLPTVRDPDGLAVSSRNGYLSEEERRRALALPRALFTRDPELARAELGDLDVDYVEVADFDPPVLAAAVRIGETRLIDNVILEGEPT